ncbi:dnaJ homolog subfamily C member 25-like [Symsagittifera roscoffensis]|uniref:dnaJ homolog subfamily C member 25-like n=1 Tax=Symsagittifera roscoffensis TaxID=84072 RepID=UPI00307C7DA1
MLLVYSLFLPLFAQPTWALIEGIYCGLENCYDVLGVTRDATPREITKAYRKLAREYHPDSNKDDPTAHDKFITIATAYETLKDEETRTEYNSMLDNPDQIYRHYYRYYRRKAPNVDVRLVLVVTISVISAIQYYACWYRYHEAISYLVTVAKYRNMAIEIAQDRGLFDTGKNKVKGNRGVKEEMKSFKEQVIRDIVAENMDIQGGYSKPDIYCILWVQLFTWPYQRVLDLKWLTLYFVNHTIFKKPLGREQKLYKIRKNLKLSESQFNYLEPHQINEYLDLKLWEKDSFDDYKREKEEEQKLLMANNAKLKKYKRWLKNHGTGRMTFED